MSVVDELFEATKQGIKEILESDLAKRIAKYVYKDIEFKLTDETIDEMLPILQAINAGLLDEVVVYDIDGNEIVMSAEEYVARNQEGFKNRIIQHLDFDKLIAILEKIQTFTALANFGSFDMAKKFYLDATKNNDEVTEDEHSQDNE